jgi:hypothetical protein
MEVVDYIGRFVLSLLLREEEIPYDEAIEAKYAEDELALVEQLRQRGWDGDLESLDPLLLLDARIKRHRERDHDSERDRFLSVLENDERYRFALRSSTAFHEGVHFHQLIGTTFGRTLFDLSQQKCQREHAKALLSLGLSTESLWHNVSPQSWEDVVTEDVAITELLTFLLGNFTPSTAERVPSGTLSSYLSPGQVVQGSVYTIVLNATSYPLGAVVALEGWAYALSRLVIAEVGGVDSMEDYASSMSADCLWHYTLLDEALDTLIGEMYTRLDSTDRYGAIARVAYFALQVGFPCESDEHIVRDSWLKDPANWPSYRLFVLLAAISTQPKDLWEQGPIHEVLASLIRQLEQGLDWPDHRWLTIASALELSERRERATPNTRHRTRSGARIIEWPVSRPSTASSADAYGWFQRIYSQLHSKIARQMLGTPSILVEHRQWFPAWNVNLLPWPLLNTYLKEHSDGSMVRRLWFNHFDIGSGWDAGMAVLMYVLREVIEDINASGSLPEVCPLKRRRIEWRCGSEKATACNLGGTIHFCPFEDALALLRGQRPADI